MQDANQYTEYNQLPIEEIPENLKKFEGKLDKPVESVSGSALRPFGEVLRDARYQVPYVNFVRPAKRAVRFALGANVSYVFQIPASAYFMRIRSTSFTVFYSLAGISAVATKTATDSTSIDSMESGALVDSSSILYVADNATMTIYAQAGTIISVELWGKEDL